MQGMNRRTFLKLAGAGSVATAAIGAPVAALVTRNDGNTLHFEAAAGLPAAPWPAYATRMMEGVIDLTAGTGFVTSRVLAGHPGDPSDVALPGTTRLIRITKVVEHDAELRLQGVVEDRTQLQEGESSQVNLVLDRDRREVRTMFAGQDVILTLA